VPRSEGFQFWRFVRRSFHARTLRHSEDPHVHADPQVSLLLRPPAPRRPVPPGAAEAVIRRVEEVHDENLVSVFDATHGLALMRVTGARVADLLTKVCGVDLSEEVTPDGAAFRSSVAKLVTDVVRDDQDGVLSYLLHCERSSGQYLFDALIDAGDEFGIEVEGFVAPEMRGVSG
jgi:heterotetrameric sarcosine oxidase gamma subunit